MTLLEVRDLSVAYPKSGGWFEKRGEFLAVDGVDFSIQRGETLALVGESGCGKTTTARALLGFLPVRQGTALLNGVNIFDALAAGSRETRRKIQIVFQDPYGSLDPRMTVGSILAEPLNNFSLHKGRREHRVRELLQMVELSADARDRYPHELSGGQRQRVGIARALAAEAELIILDEPVSALDVSIQAQILNLLADLQESLGTSYLLISHDLAVVRHMADRICIMEQGKIAEIIQAIDLLNSEHPRTRELIASAPRL